MVNAENFFMTYTFLPRSLDDRLRLLVAGDMTTMDSLSSYRTVTYIDVA